MALTRADKNLADAILKSRPGKSLKAKFVGMIRDASRNRKKKMAKYDFLKAPEAVQRDADIKGFDDGKNSKLAIHNRARKAVIQEEIKAASKEKVPKKRGYSLIKGRSTKKGIKNKGTAHEGKRRVHTKEK